MSYLPDQTVLLVTAASFCGTGGGHAL